MKKNIIIILSAWALAYVFTSFNLWELNPHNWAKEVREVFSYICIFLIVLMPLLNKILEIDK